MRYRRFVALSIFGLVVIAALATLAGGISLRYGAPAGLAPDAEEAQASPHATYTARVMDAAWAMLVEFLAVTVSSALLIVALTMLWYGYAPDRQQTSDAGNHGASEAGAETPDFRRLLRTIYLAAAVASFVLPVVTLVLALTTW